MPAVCCDTHPSSSSSSLSMKTRCKNSLDHLDNGLLAHTVQQLQKRQQLKPSKSLPFHSIPSIHLYLNPLPMFYGETNGSHSRTRSPPFWRIKRWSYSRCCLWAATQQQLEDPTYNGCTMTLSNTTTNAHPVYLLLYIYIYIIQQQH